MFDHFQPQFWLGMTATPERMDKQDVYALFDYHLAYEVRLKAALDAGMLAPFHYVGRSMSRMVSLSQKQRACAAW